VNISIQWLENDFLGYLKSWETSVKQCKGFSAKQKKMMLMPEETRQGVTGILSFINICFNIFAYLLVL